MTGGALSFIAVLALFGAVVGYVVVLAWKELRRP